MLDRSIDQALFQKDRLEGFTEEKAPKKANLEPVLFEELEKYKIAFDGFKETFFNFKMNSLNYLNSEKENVRN